jgi:glycosyltransferase involved in cell wall biosynthesis
MHLRVNADPIGIHHYFALAGLARLQRSGRIRLSWINRRLPDEPGVWIETRDARILYDSADREVTPSPERSRLADVIWKRSFRPTTDVRVRPFGLPLGCHPEVRRLPYLARASSRPSTDLRRVLASVRRPFPPRIEAYESGPQPGRGYVLFQVRAWDPAAGKDPHDRIRVNALRAAVIEGLRERFGDAFRGGFVPDEYARRNFPHLLSELETDRRSYLELIREADVTVSSIGLHGSNPWKLAEYLAAARPIVSEPLRFELPEPLEEGTNIAYYETAEGCIDAVERLMRDPEERASMRRANRAFWLAHGHPATLLANRLEELPTR